MRLQIQDRDLSVRGTFPRIIGLQAEYYEWVDDADTFLAQLKSSNPDADLFTFLHKLLPASNAARYDYYCETEEIAVVGIDSYEAWWNSLRHETQVKIRKAHKRGIETRLVEFDDDLVQGIKNIYDESPLRQGKPFKHYRESLELLKREHGTFLDRSQFIGAFYEGEMVGFVKVIHQEGFSATMHVISMLSHRDKAPTNALLAKCIETCAERGIRCLQYGSWSKRGLGDFKENHGFKPVQVPRYYVPLNLRGELALRLKMHRRLADLLPDRVIELAADLRNRWNNVRYATRS